MVDNNSIRIDFEKLGYTKEEVNRIVDTLNNTPTVHVVDDPNYVTDCLVAAISRGIEGIIQDICNDVVDDLVDEAEQDFEYNVYYSEQEMKQSREIMYAKIDSYIEAVDYVKEKLIERLK